MHAYKLSPHYYIYLQYYDGVEFTKQVINPVLLILEQNSPSVDELYIP